MLTSERTQHCLDVLVFHAASPLLSHSWSSDGQYCRVVKDGVNYVECACSHLSVYAASAEFATLASYNEAFYASGIICISGTKDVPCVRDVSSVFKLARISCYG